MTPYPFEQVARGLGTYPLKHPDQFPNFSLHIIASQSIVTYQTL
jgi:hypothetical protein